LLPADMVYICTFLKNHPEVNEVDLSYNEIEDEGLEILCHMTFTHTNSLEHLNLTHCDITSIGMRTFFFASEGHYIKLKTLRLGSNKLGPKVGLNRSNS
jgi:Ran GTPase-activating protein (RanGAP) involved in mRNA processing and transport